MTSTIKISVHFILLLTALLIAGCGKSEEDKKTAPPENAVVQNEEKIDSSLIRDYNSKVGSFDIDKNNYVYQCPMNYNVISDSTGSCPLCDMNLERISVTEAQKNLDKENPLNQ